MDHLEVAKQLVDDEGLRLKPYRCTAGKLTIGIGRNLGDRGISKSEAVYLLQNDVSECLADLKEIFPGQFDSFPEKIQQVLVNMRFQLGPGRFRSFKNMINAARFESWGDVAAEMQDSAWYSQVPARAGRLIKKVREVAVDPR